MWNVKACHRDKGKNLLVFMQNSIMFHSESGVLMIRNVEMGKKLLETAETLSEAAVQLYHMISSQAVSAYQFAETMKQLLQSMQNHLDLLHIEEPALMSHLICKNALYSLENLLTIAKADSGNACRKIQFEFLPLVNELYADLFFWGLCYPDKEKIWHYYRNEMQKLCPLSVPEDGKYKYDVSVVVIAYNKLEYTKLCIDYLKSFFPWDINHELILYNNGSNDGTKEYFESLYPDKQIDLQNNTKSWSILSRVAEGKYILTISNDVLILPHAIENLLKCIESDESICCVAPTCPNIPNLQTIPASYRSVKEMIEFAEKNNVSDPYRWEQRTRLNPPVLLGRSDSPATHTLYTYRYPALPDRLLAFSDDLMGLVARRKRKKCMLAKDAYVFHFGSVTAGSETHQNGSGGVEYYGKGRVGFAKIFDIDPWGTGCCYDPELVPSLNYEKSGPVNILGVNCGMGDTPLEIKAILKEKEHNTDVRIYNVTDAKCYEKDLAGLSDDFKFLLDWEWIKNIFPNVWFTYIIADGVNAQILEKETLKDLFSRLSVGGMLAVHSSNVDFRPERCADESQTQHWHIYYKS